MHSEAAMATSNPTLFYVPICNQRMSSRTHAVPLQMPKVPRKSIKNPSLREVCKRGSLVDALRLFSLLFDEFKYAAFSLEEAYAPLLELCAQRKALSPGEQIHAHMIKSHAVHNSVFLSTKLVHMYGKLGSRTSAYKLFDKMFGRTIFTWNAMINAYISDWDYLGAIELYYEMLALGIQPDACTFASVVKACAAIKDTYLGDKVHGLALKYGYVHVVYVANALVSMYAKFNDLQSARLLFDLMTDKKDNVSWNSIIAAYSAKMQSSEALELVRKMMKVGIVKNTYTFVAILHACESPSFLKLGKEIHAATLKSDQAVELYVANALIAMYARCGNTEGALRIFNSMNFKDSVSWNTLLSNFVQNDHYRDALKYFHDMWISGEKPDAVSVMNAIAASGRLGNLLNGKEIHAYSIKNRLDLNLQVGNTIVDMYAKCCCMKSMSRTFDKMLNKDFITWTTVISGYAQNECYLQALELFREVLVKGMDLDATIIGSILLVCGGLKCETLTREVHAFVIKNDLADIMIQNSMIDVYGECRNVVYARRVFEAIGFKEIISWTSMITCCVQNGRPGEALEIVNSLGEANIELDSVALLGILSAAASLSSLNRGKEIHGFILRKGFMLEGAIASSLLDFYSHCGVLEDSYKIFKCCKNKTLVLWTSMINANGMHGRGGLAIDLFSKMKAENIVPDHITFLVLLYACSHSGFVAEGKSLFEIMRNEYKLEPWPEHYACVVDMLGRANRLEEAYDFVGDMQIEPTAEIWCALLGACQIHSNKKLGDIAVQKLLQSNTLNPGNYVLISNLFAANGSWDDVEQVRMSIKGSGLKKVPGYSWIEFGNKIHTFRARDKSHPQSDEIYRKLAEIIEMLKDEGGYIPQTKFVLHNVRETEKTQILYEHSEKLATAYGLLHTPDGATLRISKNLRVCGDCHTFCKLVSKLFHRNLIIRDANRFHHFEKGVCSCGDYW